MAFPQPGSEWPPKAWRYWYQKFHEYALWYGGDPELLAQYYSSLYPDTASGKFWAQCELEERRTMLHVPIAGDIAATNAALLFGEPPQLNYDGNAEGGKRVSEFVKENALFAKLTESAEICAALSGVFLKLDIDPELAGVPILTTRTPYQALPEWNRDRLVAVTFHRVVKEDDSGKIWRLFEDRRREGGQLHIRYKLFQGTSDKVGREVDLGSIEETATLGLEDVTYPMEALGVVYIPNMLPNRLAPGSPMGASDFSSGLIGLMDALDEAWSSWMRDIRLGAARMLVDEDFLGDDNRFKVFQEVFVKLHMGDARLASSGYEPLKPMQFSIRVEEHMKTTEALAIEIITRAGYSPQSFGFSLEGRAESGTALRTRERKSLMTRNRKGNYWQPALWDLLMQMQQIDLASGLKTGYEPQEVDVVLQDSVVPDPLEVSETVRNLEQAKAISREMKVRMVHPDWDEETIQAEVKRLVEENSFGDPFDGMP
ncbi:MAG TPA: phage portal protein [Bacillota bacterium]|nr:phage portal protein [Bacillota bacterium]